MTLCASSAAMPMPYPLGPTRPYRRPCTMVRSVLISSSLPRADTLNPSTLISLHYGRSLNSKARLVSCCITLQFQAEPGGYNTGSLLYIASHDKVRQIVTSKIISKKHGPIIGSDLGRNLSERFDPSL